MVDEIRTRSNPILHTTRALEGAARPGDERLAPTEPKARSEPRSNPKDSKKNKMGMRFIAYPFHFSTCVRGFEPPTFWSVAKRSIQLS